MSTVDERRRQPTAQEAKALAHEVRQRILRLCAAEELTNKQLADLLGSEPGTVLPHVRILVEAGFLAPAPVRTGPSGALEKPYAATGRTWWLSDPLAGAEPDLRLGPMRTALGEALAADVDDVAAWATFLLHLTQEEAEELDRRLLAVIDDYVTGDDTRRGHPPTRGVFALHRVRGRTGGAAC